MNSLKRILTFPLTLIPIGVSVFAYFAGIESSLSISSDLLEKVVLVSTMLCFFFECVKATTNLDGVFILDQMVSLIVLMLLIVYYVLDLGNFHAEELKGYFPFQFASIALLLDPIFGLIVGRTNRAR